MEAAPPPHSGPPGWPAGATGRGGLELLQPLLHQRQRHDLEVGSAGGLPPPGGIDGHLHVAEHPPGRGAHALEVRGHGALRLQVDVVPVQLGVPQVAEGGHIELQVAVHVAQVELEK